MREEAIKFFSAAIVVLDAGEGERADSRESRSFIDLASVIYISHAVVRSCMSIKVRRRK